MKNQIFIGVDADNTLWDTDAVFAETQLGLLLKLEKSLNVTIKNRDKLSYVREIDQEIARLHTFDLKYPIEILAHATECALLGMEPKAAARIAVEGGLEKLSSSKHMEHAEWFLKQLEQRVPELREGVKEGLSSIAHQFGKIVIFTEGHEDKCWAYLKYYNLNDFIDDVVICRKSVQFYNDFLADNSDNYCDFFMIGDQLDRDIDFSKEAGFKTIYFPGGFLPEWVDVSKRHCIDFEIDNFTEVPIILKNHLKHSL